MVWQGNHAQQGICGPPQYLACSDDPLIPNLGEGIVPYTSRTVIITFLDD